MEAVQGHALTPELPFLGLADFCVADERQIWPYPEVVLDRPEGLTLDVRSDVRARVEAYQRASDGERSYMVAAGYGAARGARSLTAGRQGVLALVELGLGPAVRVAALGVRAARAARNRARKLRS